MTVRDTLRFFMGERCQIRTEDGFVLAEGRIRPKLMGLDRKYLDAEAVKVERVRKFTKLFGRQTMLVITTERQ